MLYTEQQKPTSLADFMVGQRIRLRRKIDRAPEFRVAAMRTGALTEIRQLQGGYLVCALMDLPIADDPDAPGMLTLKWGNTIQWLLPGADPVAALAAFLSDCELQTSDWPALGQFFRLRREVDRSPDLVVASGGVGVVALVDQTEGDERIEAIMDEPFFDDPEEQKAFEEAYGGNLLQWYRRADDESPLTEFLADCELLGEASGGAHA